jgi:hypothetical protein
MSDNMSDKNAEAFLPTVEECRRIEGQLREELQRVDEEVRRAHNRIAASVGRFSSDEILFLRASAMVVLTVAAGLVEIVSDRARVQAPEGAFAAAAADTAAWAKRRKKKKSGG